MNFIKHFRRRSGAILLFGLTILAHGSVNDAELQKQYQGQVLTLRQFYPGKHLHFDTTGKLVSAVAPGAWTVDGRVRVQDISLKDGVLHIRGQRLFLFFDPGSKQLRDVGTVRKTDSAKSLFRKKGLDEWAAKEGKTEIEVDCSVTEPEMEDLTKAMNAVFLAPGETFAEVVPDFWKGYLEPKTPVSPVPTPNKEGAFRVGGGVSAPRATYHPDPTYSEPARQVGYQSATTVMWLVVDRDGLPQDIRIVRPAGMGLDEAAVDTVRMWRFEPAMKDGKAVRVQINVEVNFHLY
jgi:TonB family protein